MFYPVYENADELTIAIFEFTNNDINYESAPVSGFDDDEYVYAEDTKVENYVGDFNRWGEYYLEDSIKCNTLSDAQKMLIGWVIK